MEKIIAIERQHPEVNNITINGIRVWPFYRMILRYNILISATGLIKGSSAAGSVLRNIYHLVISFLAEARHLRQWYRSYDYVIFSNDLERKEVGGKIIDKLASGVIELVGSGRVLFVSYEGGTKGRHQRLSLPNVVDGSIMTRFAALVPKKTTISTRDRHLLDQIMDGNRPASNGLQEAGTFLRKAGIVNFFLKKWKPRAVFTTCYSYYSECYAAKKNNIPVIEIQHGLISHLHPAYASPLTIERLFRADYLLTFGANSSAGLDNSVVDLDKVKVVGNLFIEKVRQLAPDDRIRLLVAGYKVSVCVPTDVYTEEELLDFILALAPGNPDIVFLIVPRQELSTVSINKLAPHSNIVAVTDLDFQNVVRHCTIHTATISTCCLEALSLGVPNILLDRDGRTRKLFGGLVDPAFTRFVTSADQFVQAIIETGHPDPEAVVASNELNFKPNYNENLAAALKDIFAS